MFSISLSAFAHRLSPCADFTVLFMTRIPGFKSLAFGSPLTGTLGLTLFDHFCPTSSFVTSAREPTAGRCVFFMPAGSLSLAPYVFYHFGIDFFNESAHFFLPWMFSFR